MREALKLALEAHCKNERHRTLAETRYWCDQYKLLAQQAIKALAQQAIKALAQPEQKPAVWMTPHGEGFRIRFSPPTNDVPLGWDALYTTPPKQEPLTDEQLEQRIGYRLPAYGFDAIRQLIKENT